MQLNAGQKHIIRLVQKGMDENDGWATVSSAVMPLMAAVPESLVELKKNDDGSGLARLTDEGSILQAWM